MIRQVFEGKIGWLDNVQLSDLPRSLPGGITLHTRAGRLGVEAQGVVGTFPLKNGDTVQIIPKVGEINFLHMLFLAEGNTTSLTDRFDEFVQYSLGAEVTLLEIVARRFLTGLDEILRRSPRQSRISVQRRGECAKGEINVPQTALNLRIGASRPVVSRVQLRTMDTAENRVLTSGLNVAMRVLRKSDQIHFHGTYTRWMRRFQPCISLERDLECVDEALALGLYGGARGYYRQPLGLAKILLGRGGLAFGITSDVTADAALLNSASVFETYVRNIISKAYLPKGHIVSKGGPTPLTLYTDGSFELCPDIVVTRSGSPILIADAKYKDPTSADHYQMTAYMNAYGLSRGLLISPTTGKHVEIKEYLTTGRRVVRELRVPLGDWKLTEETLSGVVENFGG